MVQVKLKTHMPLAHPLQIPAVCIPLWHHCSPSHHDTLSPTLLQCTLLLSPPSRYTPQQDGCLHSNCKSPVQLQKIFVQTTAVFIITNEQLMSSLFAHIRTCLYAEKDQEHPRSNCLHHHL